VLGRSGPALFVLSSLSPSSSSSNSPAVLSSALCSSASRCLSVCPVCPRVYPCLIAYASAASAASAASLVARRYAFSWASYSLFTVLGPVSKRLLVLYSFTFLPLYLGVKSGILTGRSYSISTFLPMLIRLS
jgi:hypothetical protein